jgi:cysteine desulfurase
MTRPVYFDYNATAPLKPAVIEAMTAALRECGNASSVHRFGRLARRAIEAAREDVAALVGATAPQVVFTSGGTEANNLALSALGHERRVIVSAVEHDSILNAAPGAELLPVSRRGRVDLAALQAMLERDKRPALVCVMLANNETGATQPVALVAHLARSFGAMVHCDAVQAAGKMKIDMARLGVDSLSLSAHKLGGPQGIGALVVTEAQKTRPLLRGGGQERGWRAGTENVAAIRGFGVAARLAAEEFPAMKGLAALRDDMEARLLRAAPEAVLLGPRSGRLPNTSCIALPGLSSETQVMALDLAGIAVSAGSACSSGKVRPSHVLRAMNVDPAVAGAAIRISLGWRTEPGDIDHLVSAWTALVQRARANIASAERTGQPVPAA